MSDHLHQAEQPGHLIEVTSLSKRYRRAPVLRDLTFQVGAGELVALVGANGSGKSTVLKCLIGLARPSGGRASIGGRPLHDHARPARWVGVQIDLVQPDDRVTGRDHLDLVHGWAGDHRAASSDRLVAALEMGPYLDEQIGTYSTGMRRRLALVAALMFDPPVLLFDEPTNGLDPWATAWLAAELRRRRDAGAAVLVATHDLEWAAAVADRVIGIRDGAIWIDAPVDDRGMPDGLRVGGA